ncbi:MAG: hypothetical protein WCV83_01065 [Candidatus Magasanikbacteria bacterium]
MKKLLFYLLLLLTILLPLAIVSNSFDADLGWHLRFGQELHSGNFPYTDTYTYSKFGSPWTNHEWGGDWLFWLIYSKIGYWWLNVLCTLSITLAFLILGKTFYKKISSTFLATTVLCQWAITHIFVTRLAMFTPLFAALTFYLIEKAKINHRWLYLIPPMFWLWSALHGSWILGFIILNLYLISALVIKFVPKKYFNYLNETRWPSELLYKIILMQIMAVILITINPYGIKIWQEIFQYFGQNYYKLHTTEWLPSYTFPIFWKILIIQTVSLVFVVYGFIKKKVEFTHLLIFLAFFYTSIQYKRQAILIGLLSAVVLAYVFDFIKIALIKIKFLNDNIIKNSFYFFSISVLVLLSLHYASKVHFTTNIWEDKYLTERNSYPYEAVRWLKNKTIKPIKIFNSFNWGGYMNWTMPNALVYFDGRGTATWMYDKNKTMLENYGEIVTNPDGIKEIEKDEVDFVIRTQTNFIPMAKPDIVNDWMFGKDAAEISFLKQDQLSKDLDISNNWKKVYSDKYANIWQNLNHVPR